MRPARRLRGVFLRGFAALCLAMAPAAWAQQPTAEEADLLEKARQAFFHVEVNGSPLDLSNPLHEARRFGKAFAIGGNMLVTALHVVGDESEWRLARTTRDEITRAVRPLDRRIELRGANGAQNPLTEIIVLPAPTHSIDAASMLVPGLNLDGSFQLSMCEISEGEVYSALMTVSDQPAERESVNSVELVPVLAAGYDPSKYGSLYVFNPQGTPPFASEPWGHGGSPIFDREGNVVALVSAVTVTSDGPKILATPVQPLFPGATRILAREPDRSTTAHARLKCSMVDMVKRIHDQVASHAIWTVTPETEDGQPTGDILFEYESVADPPNISSIEVRYEFWGFEFEGDVLPTRIPHRRSNFDVVNLEPRLSPRGFATSEIVNVGRTLVMNYLNDLGGGGWIEFVRLRITPTLTTGEPLTNRRKTYDIRWSALQ